MKQLLQYMRDGRTMVAEVPVPALKPGTALVRTGASLVSAGTERMVVEFAGKNMLEKARSRPDLVRQVLEKARREGILSTIDATFNRLDQPMSLGYASAGTIVDIGEGLHGFKPGDRVACAGGGYAIHAEYEIVPQNLLVRLPETVDFESAAFATLGAIALQGFRLAQPQIGERVAVIGLGLLGLLSVGIARAAGCQVFGVDLDPRRIALAQQYGATAVIRTQAEDAARAFTQGRGFDSVLICADTHANDPIQLAGSIARDRGTVVAVGAVGLNIPRKIYYEKELQVIISRSYGPGRYDTQYEEKGKDYPFGYVRWTEGRNIEAIVDLLSSGKLDVHPIITHRFPIEQAPAAYELITGKTGEPFLGVVLTYAQPEAEAEPLERRVWLRQPAAAAGDHPGLGVLGAGNYAGAVFLPVIKQVGGFERVGIATASGLSARHAAQRFGFQYAATDEAQVLQDEHIQAVALLTRHHLHARQASAALAAGKSVFCEKPLAIQPEELADLREALTEAPQAILMGGFNRRFAPFSVQLAQFLAGRAEPLWVHYRVNAGFLPDNHWLHDLNQGGGRIIGEGCHFVDYLTFLVGSAPVEVRAQALPDQGRYHEDNVNLEFRFADGSLGTVSYLANGNKNFAKERVEVFCGGRVAVLDDFRSLELNDGSQRRMEHSYLRQDKGHRAGWNAFYQAVSSGGEPPIPYDQLFGVASACFAAVAALRSGEAQTVAAA
jgi:predicted dehydrogenase/threonine dehydrogenase-like Zn-dependent dehydrogenase